MNINELYDLCLQERLNSMNLIDQDRLVCDYCGVDVPDWVGDANYPLLNDVVLAISSSISMEQDEVPFVYHKPLDEAWEAWVDAMNLTTYEGLPV